MTSLGSALLPLMWGWAIAAHQVVARERRTEASPIDGADGPHVVATQT